MIPRLERWFLRQRDGLHTVQSLHALLARSERHCLVGCGNWAWRFMVKSAGADLALPRPQIFEAFDARSLRDWFATLARDKEGVEATFRLAGNGDDLLACKDDDGEPLNPYLRQLAEGSGGIPWVAWNLLRAGLKVSGGQEPLSDRVTSATAGNTRTVWVFNVDDPALPPSHEDRSLLGCRRC